MIGGRVGAWARHGLAALLLLAGALFAVRPVLTAPRTTFPFPRDSTPAWRVVGQNDQKLSAANVAWGASRFLHEPAALYDPGQCYPATNAGTLGPAQLGEGLVGALPFALTGDPVLTFNAVIVLELWIAGLARYAFVFALGGSAAAAFVAALLFALHPQRIVDVAHPDVHGNHWTPLALLFAHRTFVHGRWRDAAGLTLFLVLQLLGNIYQVLGLTVLGGTYAAFLAARNARRLPASALPLAVATAATAVVAWWVLGPYLHTLTTWQNVGGRFTILNRLEDFTPGHDRYPGSFLVLLAAVGLADRWRGPRTRLVYDPRLALLVAGLMTVWASVDGVPFPGLATPLPSLFALASRVLHGLDAIRAGAVIGFGAVLTAAVLAGYGVLALIEGRPPVTRLLVTMGIALAALLEVFVPAIAARSFGRTVELERWTTGPPAVLVALYRQTPAAPILDVPIGFGQGRFGEQADSVFQSAFHLRPIGACYNSFHLPIQEDIQRIAERIGTDPRALDALHALGFGTLVVDALRVRGKGSYGRIGPLPGRLTEIGRAAARTAYRIESPLPVTTSLLALGELAAPPAPITAMPPSGPLTFTFRNRPDATFRHPDPIEPTRVRLQWRTAGAVVREDDAALLLPIALAAGEESTRTLTVPVPAAAGTYEVTLAPVIAPDLVLARQLVQVTSAPAPPAP